MDNPQNWGWTAVYTCNTCGMEFYVANPDGAQPDFCPFCSDRDIN